MIWISVLVTLRSAFVNPVTIIVKYSINKHAAYHITAVATGTAGMAMTVPFLTK